jgi:hypothetical protein
VKRNIERFPKDFMFQLTSEEFSNLKSQIVTSSWGGMRRSTPYAFTEQGVAMLSSVQRKEIEIRHCLFKADESKKANWVSASAAAPHIVA